MNRCILLALVAVYVFVAVSQGAAKKNTSFVKNFAKINDYLEKKVSSDNFEVNIEKAEEWLKEKSKLSLFLDRSFELALRVFIKLPEAIKDVAACADERSRILLEKCDDALSDEAHLNTKNYPLKRIDRILEFVARKSVRLCRLDKFDRPAMKFTFKQVAYDHINVDLVNKTSDDDPETNMKAAEAILRGLDNQEGSYAVALKQFLSLRSVLTENSCNEQGTEIVIKNDLATKGETHTRETPSRRISKLVRHYSAGYSSICQPIYQRNCLDRLNQLDEKTYRRVLALASAYHLRVGKLDDLVEEVESKQVGEDFTTQLVDEIDKTSGIAYPKTKLFQFLKAATKQDPRSMGKVDLMEDKIGELYSEYVHEPCDKFNRIMGLDKEVFDYQNWKMIISSRNIPDSWPLNFRLLHSAFHTCRLLLNNREYYFYGLMRILKGL